MGSEKQKEKESIEACEALRLSAVPSSLPPHAIGQSKTQASPGSRGMKGAGKNVDTGRSEGCGRSCPLLPPP